MAGERREDFMLVGASVFSCRDYRCVIIGNASLFAIVTGGDH